MKSPIDSSWYRRPPDTPEHEAAGGVVARLRDGRVEIALIREDQGNLYVLPKGHVDPGESPAETAAREIEEEAGFSQLRYLADLGARERLDFKKSSWKRTHYYLYLVEGDRAEPHGRQEFVTRWFPLDDLPAFFWPEQEALVRDQRDRISRWVKKA
jgi:8-oxo-dGTP pyrophosphatase MutT (NUDIX family)